MLDSKSFIKTYFSKNLETAKLLKTALLNSMNHKFLECFGTAQVKHNSIYFEKKKNCPANELIVP